MAHPVEVVRKIFKVNKTAKVSVIAAHELILEELPGTSSRKAGFLLRAAFGNGNFRRQRPGRTNTCRNPGYYYYGLEVATPVVETAVSSDPKFAINFPEVMRILETPNEKHINKCDQHQEEIAKLQDELETLRKDKRELLHQLRNKSTRPHALENFPPSMKLRRETVKLQGHKVGKGAFGTCELATYKDLPAVAKFFNNCENLSHNELRRKVKAEAVNILRLQDHPNLPVLFGICTESLPFCLVMQFNEIEGKGITVFQAIRDNNLRGVVPWVSVCEQVGDGLAEIHRACIIHGDLHESNVVFRTGYIPVIIDFGKARSIGSPVHQYGLSPEEQETWSRRYQWIAPELLKSKGLVSPHTDVYSFGFIMSKVCRHAHVPEMQKISKLAYQPDAAKRASLSYILAELRALQS